MPPRPSMNAKSRGPSEVKRSASSPPSQRSSDTATDWRSLARIRHVPPASSQRCSHANASSPTYSRSVTAAIFAAMSTVPLKRGRKTVSWQLPCLLLPDRRRNSGHGAGTRAVPQRRAVSIVRTARIGPPPGAPKRPQVPQFVGDGHPPFGRGLQDLHPLGHLPAPQPRSAARVAQRLGQIRDAPESPPGSTSSKLGTWMKVALSFGSPVFGETGRPQRLAPSLQDSYIYFQNPQ